MGPEGSWPNGLSPANVRRDELPMLDRGRAESLLADFERYMAAPYKAPGIVERAKKALGGRK